LEQHSHVNQHIATILATPQDFDHPSIPGQPQFNLYWIRVT